MENTMKKIYGGLIILALKEEDIPQIGQVVDLNKIDNSADAEAYGVLKGKGIYLAQSEEIINQISGFDISKAKDFNQIYGNVGTKATVLAMQPVTLKNGKIASMLIVEADMPTQSVQQPTKKVSGEINIEFAGQNIKFPAKADFLRDYTADANSVVGNLKVVKKGSELTLLYNNLPVGANAKEQIVNLFKLFEDTEINAEFRNLYRGVINVSVKEDDLKIDTSNMFDAEITQAESLGIARDEIDARIELMLYYGLEPNVIKTIISGWKKYDAVGESLIPSLADAVKTVNGKKYYSYIDTSDTIHDLAAWTLMGTPIRLIGEMSVGKNLAIKTLGTLFRKPILRMSLHSNTDDTVLIGDKTLNDGVLEFEAGLPIQAAQKGYWCVLDEVNAAPADTLIALHSLLESEDGTITIKEIGKIVPSEDFRIFATMNPATDDSIYAGTKDLNAAFESRFTSFDLKNELSIKEILKNKCYNATDADINIVSNIYNCLATIVKDPTKDFPSSFIAVRAYVDILNGPNTISLKKRCYQKLANLNTSDASYREVVTQTIDDIMGK